MVSAVSHFLAALTFLSAAFVGLTALALILPKGKGSLMQKMRKALNPLWLEAVLIVSLVSTLGSLFYSEVAGFTPCLLCWYQRIMMYPLPLLSYLALLRGERVQLRPYVLLMSVAGMAIALYHNAIQWLPRLFATAPCDASGVSCAKIYPVAFGWVTIPMMSFMAFLLLAVILTVFAKPTGKKK